MDQERSYWDLIGPHWDKLGEFDTAADFRTIASSFPRPIVLLFASHFSQSEICNGGFLQFFTNSTGLLAPEAVEAFHAISMPLTADVVAEAMSILGKEYPREREQRSNALLTASTLTADELHTIFSTNKSHYLAYRRATMNLGFDNLNEQFFALLRQESGGFEAAASAYAAALERTLVWPGPSPDPSKSL